MCMFSMVVAGNHHEEVLAVTDKGARNTGKQESLSLVEQAG